MIVDANVPIYWSIPCPFAEPSARIMSRQDLCAPSFLLVEAANGLLKYARAGVLHLHQIQESIDLIQDAILEFVLDGSLLDRATHLAWSENHSIYDCLYLALAMQKRHPLATADQRLATLARKYGIPTELIEPAP